MARFVTSPAQQSLPLDAPKAENRPAGAFQPKPTLQRAPGVRANKYGGKCGSCGGYVEAEAGRVDQVDGKWVVSHNVCPEVPAEAPAPVEDATALPEGIFTVVTDEGHTTIRVTRQSADDDFMPGRQLVAYLSGPDNTRDYTRFGHVLLDGSVKVWARHQASEHLRVAVRVLLGDPSAARLAYAMESSRCSLCNRVLTVPASVHAGLGPECAKKAL